MVSGNDDSGIATGVVCENDEIDHGLGKLTSR
jgi:hypothetical protein